MKNANNWKLLAFLVVLILIFAGIKYFRSSRLKSNLPEEITDIDSAKVTEIIIIPAREKASEIHLTKANGKWSLKSQDRIGRLEQGGASMVLLSLKSLKPTSMITKRQERWNDYNVGDSTGTRVKVLAAGSVETDIWIGRTAFSQPVSGGMFGGGFTYVRLQGENAVYTVDALLEGQFNRGFNDWRDKSFIRFNRDSLDKVIFNYPADSSFVLEKKNKLWVVNGAPADSVKVAPYLYSIAYKNLPVFSELVPVGEPVASILFENKGKSIVKLEAWNSSNGWTLRSSLQPDVYFLSTGPTLDKEIWKGRKELSGSHGK